MRQDKDWLKVPEAAQLLDIQPRTLYALIRTGKFPADAVSKRPGLSMRVNLKKAIPERFAEE